MSTGRSTSNENAHDRRGRMGRMMATTIWSMAGASRGMAFIAFAFVGLSATADTILVSVDLQKLNQSDQVSQPGWQVAEISRDGASGTQPLPVTPLGSASGVGATLVTSGNWWARGGPSEAAPRGLVQGTSLDGVLSDLWFTRDLSFSLQLSGLAVGQTYTLRAWHNDSYTNTSDGGSAAGGGTVQASLTGGTVSAAVDGTITNLFGSLTDTDFVATSMTFQPSSSTAAVTFTRIGGGFTGVPLNGVELLAVSGVPEIDPNGIGSALALLMGFLGLVERGRRKVN